MLNKMAYVVLFTTLHFLLSLRVGPMSCVTYS